MKQYQDQSLSETRTGCLQMASDEIKNSKRQDLLLAVDRLLAKHEQVRGVVAVGSVGAGQPRESSDIDAIVYMDPVDRWIVPAESIWCPGDDSFHSIFTKDADVRAGGIQLDIMLRDLRVWSDVDFEWPESEKAGLVNGWIAFDRSGEIQALLNQRTCYVDDQRLQRLDDFMLVCDDVLVEDAYQTFWDRYPPIVALSRLDRLFDAVVSALYAYNRTWRGFKNREMEGLLRLAWLPDALAERLLKASILAEVSQAAYVARALALKSIADEITAKLVAEGVYGEDPCGEAFVRRYAEPGRAWNMDAWNAQRRR